MSRHIAFDGEGARVHGGRWTHPGTAVIYTAATLALAILEFLTVIERRVERIRLYAHDVELPNDASVRRVHDAELPSEWRSYPHPVALRDIGTEWARSGATLLLAVPSAVLPVHPERVPTERNYLIHPGHPEFRRVRAEPILVDLDPRMWR